MSLLKRNIQCIYANFIFFSVDEGGKDPGQTASDAELGVQFTEIFIKKTDNVSLLLGLLEVCHNNSKWSLIFELLKYNNCFSVDTKQGVCTCSETLLCLCVINLQFINKVKIVNVYLLC